MWPLPWLMALGCSLFDPCNSASTDVIAIAQADPKSSMAMESNLLQTCPQQAAEAARMLLHDDTRDPDVLRAAIRILSEAPTTKDLPEVAAFLTYPSAEVRGTAAVRLNSWSELSSIHQKLGDAMDAETELPNMVLLASAVGAGDAAALMPAVERMAERVSAEDRARNTLYGTLDAQLQRLGASPRPDEP